MLKLFTVVVFGAAAAACDRKTCRIPNVLVLSGALTGLAFCIYAEGAEGLAVGLSGAAVPLLICVLPFVISALGAGDVKFMMAAGTYFGPFGALRMTLVSFIAGAVWSVWLIASHPGMAGERAAYLKNYIANCLSGQAEPYTDMADPDISRPWLMHFSAPVFAGIFFEAGLCLIREFG